HRVHPKRQSEPRRVCRPSVSELRGGIESRAPRPPPTERARAASFRWKGATPTPRHAGWRASRRSAILVVAVLASLQVECKGRAPSVPPQQLPSQKKPTMLAPTKVALSTQ